MTKSPKKNEDSKSNIDFLKKEYGTGGGTHYFPDGTQAVSYTHLIAAYSYSPKSKRLFCVLSLFYIAALTKKY